MSEQSSLLSALAPPGGKSDRLHCEERSDEAIQNPRKRTGLLRFVRNDGGAGPASTRLLGVIGLALALGYLIVLAGACLNGQFLLDAQGRPLANDFVNVFAAGELARAGNAAAAYDWTLHKAAEIRAVGHDFANYYGWHYPPIFLFVATALAMLPYLVAAIAWLATTLAAFAATFAAVLGSRAGLFLALGFPATLWNIAAGQNGFFTAALIGGTLGLLEKHPALAGICLGLLTYKPQFGILFPIVLIADRRWLTVIVAAVVALALAGASWLAFGTASWEAFVHWLPVVSHATLGEGLAGWTRLQSLYALVRIHGGSDTLAALVQATLALTLAVGLVCLWRSRAPYEIKASALAAGTLLATPYVYIYDEVVLAVPVAFLLRLALARGLLLSDAVGLAGACALLLAYPYIKLQVGLVAALIVLATTAARLFANSHHAKTLHGQMPRN